MQPFYLKFGTKEAASAALIDAFGEIETGSPILFSHTHALDQVGSIDGVSGWHVNLMADTLPPSLTAYEIHPVTPARIFA